MAVNHYGYVEQAVGIMVDVKKVLQHAFAQGYIEMANL